jgi:hypothetical protein
MNAAVFFSPVQVGKIIEAGSSIAEINVVLESELVLPVTLRRALGHFTSNMQGFSPISVRPHWA